MGRLVGVERHRDGARVRFGGSDVGVVRGGVVVDGVRRAIAGEPLQLSCGPFDVVVSDVKGAGAVKDDGVDVGWWRSASMAVILVLGTIIGMRLTPKIPDLLEDDLYRGRITIARVTVPPAPIKHAVKPQARKPVQMALTSRKDPKPKTMKEKRDDDRALALAALQELGFGTAGSGISNVFGAGGSFAGLDGLRAPSVADRGLGTRGILSGDTDGDSDGIGIEGRLGDRTGHVPGTIELTGRRNGGVTVDKHRIIYDGSLDRSEIQRVMDRAMSRFKYCYEKQLGGTPDLEGKLTTAFTIAGSGDVAVATAVQSTLNNDLDSCVIKVLRSLKFPAPRGGGVVQVTYPFVFASH